MPRGYPKLIPAEITKKAPADCDWEVGDTVSYITADGAEFGPYIVLGFTTNQNQPIGVYLNQKSYWVPMHPKSLVACTTKPKKKIQLVFNLGEEDRNIVSTFLTRSKPKSQSEAYESLIEIIKTGQYESPQLPERKPVSLILPITLNAVLEERKAKTKRPKIKILLAAIRHMVGQQS